MLSTTQHSFRITHNPNFRALLTLLQNIIKLFFGDHPPPHFHAVYGEYNAVFDIETLKMIEGDLPNRAEKMVLEWSAQHQQALLEMWTTQDFHKLPPLR